MGDFSHHCSLSGLTMGSRVPVVAWNVQKSKYEDTEHPSWIPTSFPVFGVAGDYGNIVDMHINDALDHSKPYVMAHSDFFGYARTLWDDSDGSTSLYDTIVDYHQRLKEEMKHSSHDEYRTIELYVRFHSNRNFFYWFEKIYFGEPDGGDGKKFEERMKLSGLESIGVFQKQLFDLVIKGESYPNLKETCTYLENMLCCYLLLPRISGKKILPVGGTYAPQWTDYKDEQKWFSLINKKALALKKEKAS